jgi:hypothetical protein
MITEFSLELEERGAHAKVGSSVDRRGAGPLSLRQVGVAHLGRPGAFTGSEVKGRTHLRQQVVGDLLLGLRGGGGERLIYLCKIHS